MSFRKGQKVVVTEGPMRKSVGTITELDNYRKYGPISLHTVSLYGVEADFYPKEIRPLTRWERFLFRLTGN